VSATPTFKRRRQQRDKKLFNIMVPNQELVEVKFLVKLDDTVRSYKILLSSAGDEIYEIGAGRTVQYGPS
jgi:hypothetical protein